ncbi:hypothetical protein F0562_026058 [Nyssa sinensis]|uniref:RING-type domain-containing protein n=1 Tax=Nyssa sinensis TaxID=561372 RepID=A0A5J5BAH1_9ASTE|nr:hypothetical protein F0562_026058 [Nyssa sinensis]
MKNRQLSIKTKKQSTKAVSILWFSIPFSLLYLPLEFVSLAFSLTSPLSLLFHQLLAIMSNEEEKKCPLCAEEMDWTDQQLKPCKCGYQVCVWCWHHIMDMAEKDKIEGRCPACRTPYDKEKIVGMEANCERLVTVNSNRKHKPQKIKPKTNEGRTDLTSVRVIQRKMAYVIGLPLSLADEDLLQQKEYFGQYGKVSKVSLSRTAGGAIQQFINDTCSVYITYSKEEEAVRCIHSVHGFVLEGRFLRASFGTAKYCHAWLRNMPCTNPACLYLHNFGAEEDSFSKDEVAAVHTRNRVQQIVGATHNMQQRSGNVLPPPVDEPINNSGVCTEKATVRSAPKDVDHATVISSSHLTCSLSSKDNDGNIQPPHKMTTFVDVVGRSCSSGSEKDRNVAEDGSIFNLCSEFSSVTIDKDNHLEPEYSDAVLCKVSSSSYLLSGLPWNKDAKEYLIEPFRESSNLSTLGRADIRPSDACITNEQSCLMSDSRRQVLHGSHGDLREDLICFDDQRLKVSDKLGQTACLRPSYYPVTISDHSRAHGWQHKETASFSDFDADRNSLNNHVDEASIQFTRVNSISIDGYNERNFQSSAESDRIFRCPNSFSNEEIVEHLRRLDDGNMTNDDNNPALDAVESSIISNILSMDFDACDDSLTLPHSLAELFDETEGWHGSSWNFNNSDRSRFSFAEHEGFANQSNLESSFRNTDHLSKKYSVLHDSLENKESYLWEPPHNVSRPQSLTPPGFSVPSRQPPPGFSACERTDQVLSSISGTHLVKTCSLPNNRYCAPSIGNIKHTSSDDFIDPAILVVGRGKPTNGLNNSGVDVRQAYTPQPSAYEDEAKLWLLMQQSAFAHQDPKFSQFFKQETPSAHQELRFSSHIGDSFSSLGDSYGFSSRLMDQHQTYNPFPFTQLSQQKYGNGHISNGYQPALDEFQHRNEVVMSEIQRNERLGFNKFFPGYGDLMLHVPSAGDVYSRVYGM